MRDVLSRIIAKEAARHQRRMVEHAKKMSTPQMDASGKVVGPSPWEAAKWTERSIADVAALDAIRIHAAGERANKMASRPAGQLSVVVIPQRIESPEAWEAKAKQLEAAGRKVIDTTAGPAVKANK